MYGKLRQTVLFLIYLWQVQVKWADRVRAHLRYRGRAVMFLDWQMIGSQHDSQVGIYIFLFSLKKVLVLRLITRLCLIILGRLSVTEPIFFVAT